MTSIYLIRHGQASFGQENYDQLSETGEAQAHVLGESLSKRIEKIDQVYLGTMLRHEQTATNCLSHFESAFGNKPVNKSDAIYDDGWNEYDHKQILLKLSPELSSMKEVMALQAKQSDPKKAFRKYFSDAMTRWMSGRYDDEYTESWKEFTERVHAALQRVVTLSSGAKNTFVFTSGGPISLLSQSLLGVSEEQIMKMNWTLLNCGVSKLVVTSSDMFLASLNEHTHFEGANNKHLITYT